MAVLGELNLPIIGPKDCIRDGLIKYYDAGNYKSFENMNTTWIDISGQGDDATAYNGPTHDGYYMVFDGSNDYFSATGLSGDIASSNIEANSFSFEVWNWLDTINSTEKGGLVTVGEFGDSYGIDQDNGRARFGLRPSSTLHNVTTGTLSQDTWYHLLGTYEQATNTIKFYQDTTLLGSTTVTTTGLSTTESLRLGYFRGILGGSSTGADYFHGRMGEVRIYDRALTINEVYHNFNHGRSRYGV